MVHPLAKALKRSNYRLLGLIGHGQFGRVYCATHRKTGQLLALKELAHDRFPTHKFLRELRFLLSLQHPNIVTWYALEHHSTGRYLVMDYCEGGTLRTLMEEGIQLHPMQAVKLVCDVLAGLDHAHSRGIIHCDIKPENILLSLQPGGWIARISDFGIARVIQEGTDTSNTGSPAYMAPERFYGQFSYASDIYAVGVLLFELLVGYRPFSGIPADLMVAHLNQPVQIPEDLPESLQIILRSALQKLPGRRFRSAADMLALLQRAMPSLRSAFPDWPDTCLLRPTAPMCGIPYESGLTTQPAAVEGRVQQMIGVAKVADISAVPLSISGTNQAYDRVYTVAGSRIACQTYPRGVWGAEENTIPLAQTLFLPDILHSLTVCGGVCFAVGPRSVYRIWSDLLHPRRESLGPSRHSRLPSNPNPPSSILPQLIADFSHPIVVAVHPQGYWMATLEPQSVTEYRLELWNLRPLRPKRYATFHWHRPHDCTAEAPHQLMPLDDRHIALFSKIGNSTTLLEVATRRGTLVASLKIGLPLHQLQLTPTPYRLMGVEHPQSRSLLLIDLKPLRILRVGVEIEIEFLTATTWGFVVMDQAGQMVLLDRYGQWIGRINGPSNPSAIAPFADHGLLVTTWVNGQGHLHVLDLHRFDLDFVF